MELLHYTQVLVSEPHVIWLVRFLFNLYLWTLICLQLSVIPVDDTVIGSCRSAQSFCRRP